MFIIGVGNSNDPSGNFSPRGCSPPPPPPPYGNFSTRGCSPPPPVFISRLLIIIISYLMSCQLKPFILGCSQKNTPCGTMWCQVVPSGNLWFQVVQGGARWYPVVQGGAMWYQVVRRSVILSDFHSVSVPETSKRRHCGGRHGGRHGG